MIYNVKILYYLNRRVIMSVYIIIYTFKILVYYYSYLTLQNFINFFKIKSNTHIYWLFNSFFERFKFVVLRTFLHNILFYTQLKFSLVKIIYIFYKGT
jgi:hypothetical protein